MPIKRDRECGCVTCVCTRTVRSLLLVKACHTVPGKSQMRNQPTAKNVKQHTASHTFDVQVGGQEHDHEGGQRIGKHPRLAHLSDDVPDEVLDKDEAEHLPRPKPIGLLDHYAVRLHAHRVAT